MYKKYYWEDGFFQFFAAILIGGALIFLGPLIMGTIKCDEVSRVTGRKTEYHYFSGCYIEVNGRMIPSDSWRGEQDK